MAMEHWLGGALLATALVAIIWVVNDDDASGRTKAAHMEAMPDMRPLGSQKIGHSAYYFYEFTAEGEYCIVMVASARAGTGLSCRRVEE